MPGRDGKERVPAGTASADFDGASSAEIGSGRSHHRFGAIRCTAFELADRLVQTSESSPWVGAGAQDGSARRRSIRGFAAARDGVAAVEVGLLATPFFMLLVGVLVLGLMTWCHSTLDYATQKAARKIMTGAPQSANTTLSQFKSNVLCSYLPTAVFDCSKLVVNLAVVTESAEPTGWYSYVNAQQTALTPPDMTNTNNSFCFGGGNTYQVLQVAYPFPIFSKYLANTSALAAGYSLIVSTAAFKNEPFQGGGGNGDNC